MLYRSSLCLLVACAWFVGISSDAVGDSSPLPMSTAETVADTLFLDQYPDTHAAYSLRKLRSEYEGPLLRVRRASDDAEQDFGFGSDGMLDTQAIESWLAGADGYVTTWYSQVSGQPDMTPTGGGTDPKIASNGTVFTWPETGLPRIHVPEASGSGLKVTGLSGVPHDNFAVLIVGVTTGIPSGEIGSLFHTRDPTFTKLGSTNHTENKWSLFTSDATGTFFQDENIGLPLDNGLYSLSMGPRGILTWYNDEETDSFDVTPESGNMSWFEIFDRQNSPDGTTGYVSEVLLTSEFSTDPYLYGRYDNINADWEVGPQGTNRQAILPQREKWHVDLYDWMETLDESDVTLPDGTISWDGTYGNVDELADLWLRVDGLTASSVVRSEPGWYVLDNGNGKGIEATGNVKNVDEPRGSGDYRGNPPRSWANEPAFLYQLDIPLSGGGQGNPWYQEPALARRAVVVAMVDMMMHSVTSGFSKWTDMHGKALLGWAETYKWCKDELPTDVLAAYEKGMEHSLDLIISRGARAVNTNMDMFSMKAAAEIWKHTSNQTLKDKALKAVRRTLLGDVDATQVGGPRHTVFAVGDADGGVFHPAGFIMEGGQPDIFYMGESILQLSGALAAVEDRSTETVPSEWSFLEEVVTRMQEWMLYQMFYDPAVLAPALPSGPAQLITAGAGFSGRTGAGVPSGQADEEWKHMYLADLVPDAAFLAAMSNIGPLNEELITVSEMESAINNRLSYIDGEMDNTYTNQPDDWSGWSPWTKSTPFLPPEGWYSNLQSLENNDDPKIESVPAGRSGVTWNKTFGGPTTGEEWWSYKDTDANGEAFGFFVEAMDKQGPYGGWYGGKIETFWTESTGVVLMNRHGKTGCDDNFEDSVCWDNLDEKAGHHVWGRDENGNGFTTLLLIGRELSRTSTFNTGGSPPTVTVNNVFNDPNGMEGDGEETGAELEGSVEVENKFEAQSNGLKVTHTLTSDESDEVNELWASLPVYLRVNNPEREGDNAQGNMDDTSIEYWEGGSWVDMPEDTDNDGVPEIVTTSALRLGRDYSDVLNQGIEYAYVSFGADQDVRRSVAKYYDPYQTKTGVRTVHIDLHGDPGTTKTLPAQTSVSYTLQPIEPALGEGPPATQDISLKQGGNLVSTFVVPTDSTMDAVFDGLQTKVTVVENEVGERYRPGEDINEIGQWDSGEAYLVRTVSDVTLSIEGDSLETSSVTLEEGWNWVPYFRSSALPIEEALSSITDDLVLVKDETGRVYSAEQAIEVLGQMEPGEAYQIYVRQPTTLTYPDGGN